MVRVRTPKGAPGGGADGKEGRLDVEGSPGSSARLVRSTSEGPLPHWDSHAIGALGCLPPARERVGLVSWKIHGLALKRRSTTLATRIVGVSGYLPEKIETNEDLCASIQAGI